MSTNIYLRDFRTFIDPANPDLIRIMFNVQHFDGWTLTPISVPPEPDDGAVTGNIRLVYQLVTTPGLPGVPKNDSEIRDVKLTGPWYQMPLPHVVEIILFHDKGQDQDSMNTTDPN